MHRFVGSAESLGDREVGVIASTSQLARDGHVLEPSGLQLDNFKRNPVCLRDHTTPVGAAVAVAIERGALCARVQFAPAGASDIADETCALVKAGVLRGVSIGFDPIEFEPLDPRNPRGGLHITSAELLEISFVSVPADTGAGVVARSFSARPGALVMLRALPPVRSSVVARALAEISRAPAVSVPLMALSESERTAAIAQGYRRRTMGVWATGYARDVEQHERYSAESRRAELLRLSPDGTEQ